MPRKLSPEEATVMIIRRRLQQMEEDKMAQRDAERDEDESSERDGAKRTGNDTAKD
jgi:hypothetical protein